MQLLGKSRHNPQKLSKPTLNTQLLAERIADSLSARQLTSALGTAQALGGRALPVLTASAGGTAAGPAGHLLPPVVPAGIGNVFIRSQLRWEHLPQLLDGLLDFCILLWLQQVRKIVLKHLTLAMGAASAGSCCGLDPVKKGWYHGRSQHSKRLRVSAAEAAGAVWF